MHWVTIAGFCLCLVGGALSLRHYLKTARSARQLEDRAAARDVDGMRQDLCHGALWLGISLMLMSQIAQQLQRGAPSDDIAFSLAAGAATVFTCGLFAGRLMLRRQWRAEAAAGSRV